MLPVATPVNLSHVLASAGNDLAQKMAPEVRGHGASIGSRQFVCPIGANLESLYLQA
jgi:hypothetical protein